MYFEKINLSVDSQKCIHCGLCADECQNRAIEMDPVSNIPRVAPDNGDARCMHCRHCLMICPVGALSVDHVNPGDCPAVGEFPSYGSLLNLVRGRRSHRDFEQKNVSAETISELMDAMRYVPTGVNFRNLHFSLIDDIEVMNQYREQTYNHIRHIVEENRDPAAVKFTKGMYDMHKAGKDPVFRTAPHLLLVSVREDAPTAEADPLIAVSYFELLAHALGLGTVWFGRFLMMERSGFFPGLLKPFRVPAGYRTGYAMLFGKSTRTFCRTCNPDPVAVVKMNREDVPGCLG